MPWQNTYYGIGGSGHALGATTFTRRQSFDRQLLEALFRQHGISRKIITRMPFDATREGWTRYPGIDEDLSRALQKEERRLRVAYHMTRALVYEREFGGAGTVVYVDDGIESWEPLDRSRIRAIRELYTAHRWELWPHTYRNGDYAYPEVYQLTRDSGRPTEYVHRSRILLFPGEASSDQARIESWSWGDPVIETVWEELRNIGVSDSGVIEYLVQLSVPVLRVKKWWQMIAGKDGESAAATMLEAVRQKLSAFRLLVLDSDDDVQRLSATVSGINDLLEHQKAQVAAVTDYPQTVLYGRSPEGMNATGLSDLEIYYGIVRAKIQEDRLREPLEQVLEMIAQAPVWGEGGTVTNPLPSEVRTQDPRVEFRPLWVPRELERAQVEQTRGATRVAYASLGWIDPDEGRKLLEQDGILEPPDPDEFEDPEAEVEEADPMEPTTEVSDAVSLGVLQARRSGYQVPTWEESVARRLAGGRALTRSQVSQLRIILSDPGEDDRLRAYFGGDVTLAWLRSLSGDGSRTDADDLVPWRGRQIRIEVRAGEIRTFPRTDYPGVLMPCDYGEIVGTVGLDGDPVDVLRVPGGPDTIHVGIILHPDGSLDEHKIVLGARDESAAQAILVLCYGHLAGGLVSIEDLDEFLDETTRGDAELSEADRRPSEAAAANAKRALEVRATKPPSERGMTPVGLARARDISNRKPLSIDTWRRVKAYGDRHEADKKGESWDEQGKGWQAWNGWGGDESFSQARRIVRTLAAGQNGGS